MLYSKGHRERRKETACFKEEREGRQMFMLLKRNASYWVRTAASHPFPSILLGAFWLSVCLRPILLWAGGRGWKWAAGFMMIFPHQPVQHPHTTENI